MNVPAWPIPIHQTKFVIAKPHATGILMPQMPTPFSKQPRDGDVEQHEQRERDGESAEPCDSRPGA